MPKRRDYSKVDRGGDESHIRVQLINNGLFLDLMHIAANFNQSLPTFLKAQLFKIRNEHRDLLNRKLTD
jgi:hypothetical protein